MNGGRAQQKKPALFGSHQSSPAVEKVTPVRQPKPVITQSHGWCPGFSDCMGSNVSPNNNPKNQPKAVLEQQVEELERKVENEREIGAMYRKRMDRTHDYLRYCLQVAQENGFLELIMNRKHNLQQSLLSPSINANVNATPGIPFPDEDLAALVDQAKINGWYIEPHEIKREEQIARGSTAEIYRGTWRGAEVAVKCINPDFFCSNENGVAFFAQEVEILSRQRHRFVLQLMGACLNPPDYGWVVTEFLSMTLKHWLHGHANKRKKRTLPLPPFDERVAKALEIAQAMQYLHDQKPRVIHRDLKPSNIFLDDAMHVRVGDFGNARLLSDQEMALTGETGTYVYMAPEVLQYRPYDEKCDVYSFGIILNELITGEFPFIEIDYGPSKIALEVAEGRLRPALPVDDNGQLEELVELIRLSWDNDASIRPSFATITCTLKKIQKKFIESV